jgi:hypothetical protein
MPGAWRARSLACEMKKAHEHSHHGHTGSPGIPYAMVLTVSFVLSPVIGLSCHRRLAKFTSAKLDAGVEASGPHDFAVRNKRLSSLSAVGVHRIPPRVRDDREPPLCETGRQGYIADLGYRRSEEFFVERLDR